MDEYMKTLERNASRINEGTLVARSGTRWKKARLLIFQIDFINSLSFFLSKYICNI